MAVDIIAAIVTYLETAMAADVTSFYADYAPSVSPPYALVHDGPETYMFTSANDGSNNPTEIVTADGVAFVEFVAQTKEQARFLARTCVRLLTDTVTTLTCDDGTVIHLRPVRAESVPITDIGPGVPTAFKRVVAVNYKQEFLSPTP